MASARTAPIVSVIVVTFNSESVLEACLQPLAEAEDFEIIVVDNHSIDNSVKIAQRYAKVIRNSENTGFAQAVNKGAEASLGTTLLLLNPDARISVEGVRRLATIVTSQKAVAAAAPALTHPTGRLEIQTAGSFPTIFRMLCHYTGLSRLSTVRLTRGHYLRAGVTEVQRVDWASGGCLAVKRDAWNHLGGLSERWFMYAEDVEFCWRLRNAGYEVIFDPNIRAVHLVGRSSGAADSPRRARSAAWVTNLYEFYRDNICRNRLCSLTWKYISVFGLLTRATAYWARSQRVPATGRGTRPTVSEWRVESANFVFYAKTLVREPSEIQRPILYIGKNT